MKRSFLTALGLEKDIIDQIMAEHGQTVELIKEKAKEDAEAQATRLNTKIADLQAKIDATPKPDGEDYKAKYEAEVAARTESEKTLKKELSDYKASVEAEKTTAAKREAVRKHLAADGANQKLVGLLEKEFDLSTIELDGDKVKKWDELSKSVKESYADVFAPAKVEGAPQTTPPVGGGSAALTMDQIKGMTPQEINKNWGGVKAALEKKGT